IEARASAGVISKFQDQMRRSGREMESGWDPSKIDAKVASVLVPEERARYADGMPLIDLVFGGPTREGGWVVLLIWCPGALTLQAVKRETLLESGRNIPDDFNLSGCLDTQHTDTINATRMDTQQTNGRHATNGHTQRMDTQRMDTQRMDTQRMDTHAQRMDTRNKWTRNEGHATKDTQRMDTQRMDTQRMDTQRMDTRNGWTRNGWTRNEWTRTTNGHATMDTQRMDTQRMDTQQLSTQC
ncbi:hypothetical protein THAOC_05797, partial [Thalassiosira oceanica]